MIGWRFFWALRRRRPPRPAPLHRARREAPREQEEQAHEEGLIEAGEQSEDPAAVCALLSGANRLRRHKFSARRAPRLGGQGLSEIWERDR